MNFTLGNMNVHIFDAKLTFNAHEDEKTFMLNRLNRMRYLLNTYAC